MDLGENSFLNLIQAYKNLFRQSQVELIPLGLRGNSFLTRQKNFGGLNFLSSCYGILAPNILENIEEFNELKQDLKKIAQKESFDCVLLKGIQSPLGDRLPEEFIKTGDSFVIEVPALDSKKEILWQDLGSKNRNLIRKAEKMELNGIFELGLKNPESFYEHYISAVKKLDASPLTFFNQNFFKSLEGNQDIAELKILNKNNELLSSGLFLKYRENWFYFLSFRTKLGMETKAPLHQFMLWEFILSIDWHGSWKLFLGGGHEGLQHFKRKMSNKVINHFVYLDVINPEKLAAWHQDKGLKFDPDYPLKYLELEGLKV